MVASSAAKSVLRAVCSSVTAHSDIIDYFPSYELISTPFTGERFFAADKRSVTSEGVKTVMRHFFSAVDNVIPVQSNISTKILAKKSSENYDQIVCEEELLVAFIKESGLDN